MTHVSVQDALRLAQKHRAAGRSPQPSATSPARHSAPSRAGTESRHAERTALCGFPPRAGTSLCPSDAGLVSDLEQGLLLRESGLGLLQYISISSNGELGSCGGGVGALRHLRLNY